MHLTVGYLATPTGEDGIALSATLATTFGAAVDVLIVVRHELPDGHPGRAQYQDFLLQRGEEWVTAAAERLVSSMGSGDGSNVKATAVVGDSYAESLISFAVDTSSDLIVLGGARDGLLGRHTIGSVAGELLHSCPIPVALAPRGYADAPAPRLSRITVAVPTHANDDNPLPFALELAGSAGLVVRLVSLVTVDESPEDRTAEQWRQARVEAAEENLQRAAQLLPDQRGIESIVAEGSTLETALTQLTWSTGDVLLVGSGRLAPPRRIFLGSTAARILAGTAVPVIVVPHG